MDASNSASAPAWELLLRGFDALKEDVGDIKQGLADLRTEVVAGGRINEANNRQVIARLDKLNGKVAEHEQRLNQMDIEDAERRGRIAQQGDTVLSRAGLDRFTILVNAIRAVVYLGGIAGIMLAISKFTT